MILFLAHSKASYDKSVSVFHAGCMYKRSSELGADDKIDARNKQGSRVVETGLFQDVSGRNPDHWRD